MEKAYRGLPTVDLTSAHNVWWLVKQLSTNQLDYKSFFGRAIQYSAEIIKAADTIVDAIFEVRRSKVSSQDEIVALNGLTTTFAAVLWTDDPAAAARLLRHILQQYVSLSILPTWFERDPDREHLCSILCLLLGVNRDEEYQTNFCKALFHEALHDATYLELIRSVHLLLTPHHHIFFETRKLGVCTIRNSPALWLDDVSWKVYSILENQERVDQTAEFKGINDYLADKYDQLHLLISLLWSEILTKRKYQLKSTGEIVRVDVFPYSYASGREWYFPVADTPDAATCFVEHILKGGVQGNIYINRQLALDSHSGAEELDTMLSKKLKQPINHANIFHYVRALISLHHLLTQPRSLPRNNESTSSKQRWEPNVERVDERISHWVSGFLRPLHPGWRASNEARERALQALGRPLDEGYTWVQEHQRSNPLRGSSQLPEEAEPSRGPALEISNKYVFSWLL